MSDNQNSKPANEEKQDPSKKKDDKKDAKKKEEELVNLEAINNIFRMKRTNS